MTFIFSLAINRKGQAAQRQLLRYLSFPLFLDHPYHIHILSIKSQRNLESVIPPAILHMAAHAARYRLNEKTAKSESERRRERERSVQHYQSEPLWSWPLVLPIHQRWGKDERVRRGLGSGSRVLALHPITSDG